MKNKKEFRRELKKASATGIVTALGLIIALTWKDVLTEFFNQIVEVSPLKGKLIGALIITFLSAIGIYLVTKYFSE